MLMSKSDRRFCLHCLHCLLMLDASACGASDPVGVGVVTGTSTGDPTTEPQPPTTGASADPEPPATTTMASTDGTGAESGTAGPDSGTTGGISGCGDGIVDPDEICDDGLTGNDDSRYCKTDCSLNVCGDGKLFVGWELCDEGQGNSDEYGNLCGAECTPGEICGDHKIQSDFETCDRGLDNGGMKGDNQGILCDATCRAQQLRAFVTSETFTGDLGGLFGADLKCRNAAAVAGLAEPERFHALVSSGDVDAKMRFKSVAVSLPYVLVTGKKLADNFAALVDAGPPGEGVAVTETGAAVYLMPVATNTAPGGVRFSPDQHCQGWTSASPEFKARVGLNAMPIDSPDWSDWHAQQAWLGALTYHCDNQDFRLYCLEI